MKTMIAYTKRGCLTGKKLRVVLNAMRKRTDRRAKCDLFIRWGSTEPFNNLRYKKELNSLEAVQNTVNKLKMLEILRDAGIKTLEFNNVPDTMAELFDNSGNFYIRNRNGIVRYGNDFNQTTDLYYSRPIKYKRREYRVHVFENKVLGAYEKVPLVPGAENRPKLFKADTCKFVRCNLELEGCRVNAQAREMCVEAVQSLGLTFGGVDLIRDKSGNFTVCEVNSAPGLNGMNVGRWVEAIQEYYNRE